MTWTRFGLPLILTLLLCPPLARAQNSGVVQSTEPAWEIEPYIGVARDSPAGTHLGMTAGYDHFFLAAHLTGTILRWQRLTIAYAPEVVPLLMVSGHPTFEIPESGLLVVPGSPPSFPQGIRRVAGIGGSPVGFEGRVRVASRVRLYTATAAGLIMFARPAPLPDSRRLNYTFEVSGGGELLVHRGWWLRVGYKFHHFSNGNSAPDNPGVDAKVVMIGIAHRLGRN